MSPPEAGTRPRPAMSGLPVTAATARRRRRGVVSGYVHYYLYFKGGYRDIAPDSVAGLTISRVFAINAIAGPVIAWALVVSMRVPKLTLPAAVAGLGFAAATLGAYLMTRTVGLLGFDDNQLNWEAVVAFVSEVVALASLGLWLAMQWTHRRVPTHDLGGHHGNLGCDQVPARAGPLLTWKAPVSQGASVRCVSVNGTLLEV